MSRFSSSQIVEQGSRWGTGYMLQRGREYVTGDKSQKSIWWALLTLIGSVSGYLTGQMDGSTALIVGSNAVQSIFLWLRLRKTQKNIQTVYENLEQQEPANPPYRYVPRYPETPPASSPASAEDLAALAADLRAHIDARLGGGSR